MRRPTPRRRPGFTLVELLVVIVIIGILVALLVPVIAGAIRRANDGRVTGQMNLLSNGLTAFKDRYGDYPPSRIILSESGIYPVTDARLLSDPTIPWFGSPPAFSSTDITLGELAQRSVRYLRKFFPNALAPLTTSNPYNDFNGNTPVDSGPAGPDPGLIYLEGDECLVFFLGGIPNVTGTATLTGTAPPGEFKFAASGFGRDPLRPFTFQNIVPSSVGSNNRAQAFFEFDGARLVDLDGDGIPSYFDTLNSGTDARPFAYFSCYGGQAYDPNDMNYTTGTGPTRASEQDDNGATIFGAFRLAFPVRDSSNSPPTITNLAVSFPPNPYTSSASIPASTAQAASFLNPNTYQLISAGVDGKYGIGTQYNAESTGDRLPAPAANPNLRSLERDNLSNFSTGRLD